MASLGNHIVNGSEIIIDSRFPQDNIEVLREHTAELKDTVHQVKRAWYHQIPLAWITAHSCVYYWDRLDE